MIINAEGWSTQRVCPKCHKPESDNVLYSICPFCRKRAPVLFLASARCKKFIITIAKEDYTYCIVTCSCKECGKRFWTRLRGRQRCTRCCTEWDCMISCRYESLCSRQFDQRPKEPIFTAESPESMLEPDSDMFFVLMEYIKERAEGEHGEHFEQNKSGR